MAELEDLDYTSFIDMSTDEQIEHLRQIRLSRRTPKKGKSKTPTKSKSTKKKSEPKLTPDQAKKLLDMIGE